MKIALLTFALLAFATPAFGVRCMHASNYQPSNDPRAVLIAEHLKRHTALLAKEKKAVEEREQKARKQLAQATQLEKQSPHAALDLYYQVAALIISPTLRNKAYQAIRRLENAAPAECGATAQSLENLMQTK